MLPLFLFHIVNITTTIINPHPESNINKKVKDRNKSEFYYNSFIERNKKQKQIKIHKRNQI